MSAMWGWQREIHKPDQSIGGLIDLWRCAMDDSPNAVAAALMILAGEVSGRAVLKTQSCGTVPLVFNAMYGTSVAPRLFDREQIPAKVLAHVCVFADDGSVLEIKLSSEAEAMIERYAVNFENSAISCNAHPLVISYLAQSRLTLCAIAGLIHVGAGRDGVLTADIMLEAISIFDVLFEAFEQAVMPIFWTTSADSFCATA
ncbi:hypothetical protein AQ912_10090 [Burkholderia pseudomallei]|nr:hypothetical protein AQ811_07390 [Burkholderia pseudomallei]ONC21543.1 hypothetical protein AQ912_10090 [Burkholderia pseudomallei]ONC53197.1 hypothetical protein AQ918_11720 [Burkholderia pseudomallei]